MAFPRFSLPAVRESIARTPAPGTPAPFSPAGEPRSTMANLIAQQYQPMRIPTFLYDPNLLQKQSLPADGIAEADLTTVAAMFAQARLRAVSAVRGSVTGPGAVTLAPGATPEWTQHAIPVAALAFHISLVENTGTFAAVSLNVAGNYHNDRTDVVAPLVVDFVSGAIVVAPKEKGARATLIMLPYRVIDGKTFLQPLMLSAAGISQVAATNIVTTVTGGSAGTVVEVEAVTPVHPLFNEISERLVLGAYR